MIVVDLNYNCKGTSDPDNEKSNTKLTLIITKSMIQEERKLQESKEER